MSSDREFVTKADEVPSQFLFDDSLPAIQRLQKFAQSAVPVQRHVYARRISATYEENPTFEVVTQISPLLDRLLGDSEVLIRVATVQEISAFAKALIAHNPLPPNSVNCSTPAPSHCDRELAEWQSANRVNIRDFDVICLDRDEFDDEPPMGNFSSASAKLDSAASSPSISAHSTSPNQPSISSIHSSSSSSSSTADSKSAEPSPPMSAALTDFVAGAEYEFIRGHLITALVQKLNDPEAQVRQAAIDSLLSVTLLLHPDDRVRHVFKPLLDMTQNGNRDESKCLALSLMAMLASHVEAPFTQGFVVPTLQFLSQDSAFRVRKTAASALGQVALCCNSNDLRMKLVSHDEETISGLLPPSLIPP